MNGKYSDHAAQDLRSNDEMLSCCAFAQADLNIFFLQLAILQVKTSQTFTSEQRQLGSDYARACGMNMAKKKNMRIMCADAGLSLTPHVRVYLCLCCCHKCRGQKEQIHDEFKHPSIFGVPALLFTVKFFKE